MPPVFTNSLKCLSKLSEQDVTKEDETYIPYSDFELIHVDFQKHNENEFIFNEDCDVLFDENYKENLNLIEKYSCDISERLKNQHRSYSHLYESKTIIQDLYSDDNENFMTNGELNLSDLNFKTDVTLLPTCNLYKISNEYFSYDIESKENVFTQNTNMSKFILDSVSSVCSYNEYYLNIDKKSENKMLEGNSSETFNDDKEKRHKNANITNLSSLDEKIILETNDVLLLSKFVLNTELILKRSFSNPHNVINNELIPKLKSTSTIEDTINKEFIENHPDSFPEFNKKCDSQIHDKFNSKLNTEEPNENNNSKEDEIKQNICELKLEEITCPLLDFRSREVNRNSGVKSISFKNEPRKGILRNSEKKGFFNRKPASLTPRYNSPMESMASATSESSEGQYSSENETPNKKRCCACTLL